MGDGKKSFTLSLIGNFTLIILTLIGIIVYFNKKSSNSASQSSTFSKLGALGALGKFGNAGKSGNPLSKFGNTSKFGSFGKQIGNASKSNNMLSKFGSFGKQQGGKFNITTQFNTRFLISIFVLFIILLFLFIYRNKITSLFIYKEPTKQFFDLIYNKPSFKCKFKTLPLQYWNHKLSEFYIASSYKPYFIGKANSLESIKHNLVKGSRFIRLDLLESNKTRNANVVVSNGKNNLLISSLFYNCCNIINQFAWNYPMKNSNNYPLILYLNFNNDLLKRQDLLKKIAEIIYSVFNKRLLSHKYSFNGKNNKVTITDDKLINFKNKIIISSNIYPFKSGYLNELININLSSSSTNFREYKYTKEDEIYNNIPNTNSKFSDTKEFKLYNHNNLTCVYKDMYVPINGIIDYLMFDPTDSSKKNINPINYWKHGAQIVCMDYSKYNERDKNNNMFKYMHTKISSVEYLPDDNNKWSFSDASFLLKPTHLREKLLPHHIKSNQIINNDEKLMKNAFGHEMNY